MTCKLVAYYRVSTKGQGESGLGLEGQQAAVLAHAQRTGCEIVRSFTEVESGRVDARPELVKALAWARRAGATLVIAKMDRLSRDVHFLSGLMKGDVPFVACDNPHATPLTIHILAAVAENEAEDISLRTKAALAAYKASGRLSKRIVKEYGGNVPPEVVEATAGKLGASLPQCRNLTDEARKKGAKAAGSVSRAKAIKAMADDVEPIILELRGMGLTLQNIADHLNREGYQARKGGRWGHVQVMRILKRSAAP